MIEAKTLNANALLVTYSNKQELFDRASFLYKHLGDNITLVLRGAHLSKPCLIDFIRLLGTPQKTQCSFTHKDHPEILVVSNEPNHESKTGLFADGELYWHSDNPTKNSSQTCIALCCDQPAHGGNTSFTNFQLAFQDLPANLKRRAELLKINLTSFGNRKPFRKAQFTQDLACLRKISTTKPLVVAHPISQKKGLYFPFLFIENIVGLDSNQSEEIIKQLVDHCLQEKYIYRHSWEKGDIILNDQTHSIHRRELFEGSRRLYRLAFNYY